MTDALLRDAVAISTHWLDETDLVALCRARFGELELSDVTVDLVAIGKAAREMAGAATSLLGERVQRRLIVADERATPGRDDPDVLIGEHPRPGWGSQRAGGALLAYLGEPTDAEVTLFLLSGGASSICVAPVAPVGVADLATLFDAAVTSGLDITALNQLRAAVSIIAGGGVLRHVRTPRSASVILVDNVISGARWVASALTYDYRPSREEVERLLGRVPWVDASWGEHLLEGAQRRVGLLMGPSATRHENVVLADPSLVLRGALDEARRRGYDLHDLGASVQGDVRDVASAWGAVVRDASIAGRATAVLGVGEVTVRVRGAGRGGRCQEFAWLMARELEDLEGEALFLARASDGRDYLQGVAGAWVDTATVSRAEALGVNWRAIATENDSNRALDRLGQLIEGGHTGWNLCDLYLVLLRPPGPRARR